VALRALVAAHAQSAWNRSTRQLTRAGRNLALAFIVVAWLTGAGGFGSAMLALGWVSSREGGGEGVLFAGAALFVLSWGLGLVFGLTGSGRLLEVGQLRAYPVRPLTVLFAELAARLAEPLTLGAAFGLFCFHLGLAGGRPELAPRLAVLFPINLFILVGSQLVLGELLAAVARRARIALVLVFALSMGFSPRAIAWLESSPAAGSRLERYLQLAHVLPTTRLLAAPEGGVEALLRLLEGLVAPLLIAAAGAWVMAREQTAHANVATERETGLWTFGSPQAGIARLHLSTLFRTPVGRYSLIAPLFAMVMVPWIVQLSFGVQRTSLAVFMYAALGTVQFHFNMFGFDGPSIGELFRLPVSSRAIVLGKHAATLALAVLEGAVLCVFLLLVRGEAAAECLAGFCVFISVNLVMASVGRFISVIWPRTLPRSGMRGAAPPLPVVLVNLFGTLGITGALGTTHWAVLKYAPGLLVPWGLAVLALGAGLFWVTLEPGARFLEARREHVLLGMR